jgi:hypothetical protein
MMLIVPRTSSEAASQSWDTRSIGGWLAGPAQWDDPYELLEFSSDLSGGAINSNWDNAKGTNGIDW